MRYLILLPLLACGSTEPEAPPPEPAPKAEEGPKHATLFAPLPADMADPDKPRSDELIDLGRRLYFDERLSKNHDISCNSCHPVDRFGADGLARSPGHKGELGGRNSPTTFNAANQVGQFWDGRADTVEDQATGPMTNPVEMAMPSDDAVVAVIASIPGYVELHGKAFEGDEPLAIGHAAAAIGAFERGLVTPGRFDAYLGGQLDALTADELAGYDLFVETGCVSCHNGPLVGGKLYQKLGLVEPYETSDPGRFAVTDQEADKGFFKVPTLRNVSKTGPYLHDGSVAELSEAVRIMAKHQLGKQLDDAQIASIVTFLGALEGEIDASYVERPEPFASGPDTPAPDPS